MSPSGAPPQAGWYLVEGEADLYRYHDGQDWTPHLRRSEPAEPAGSTYGGGNGEPGVSSQAAAGSAPVAGWYPDPQTAEQQRYWDGTRWTEATRPVGGSGRRKGWLVALAIVAALGMIGAVVLQTALQRGAASPQAAAQELAEAVAVQDWGSAARLLPPDEIDWARDTLEQVRGRLAFDEGVDEPNIELEVELGAPEALADGIEVVPVLSLTADVPDDSALGRAGMVTDGRETEDFRDDPAAVLVVVERSGRWYVSPLGTLLEIGVREDEIARDGSMASAAPRSGAADPEQVVERATHALRVGDFDTARQILHPEELQVLDRYVTAVNSEFAGEGVELNLQTRVEGSEVVLERVGDSQGYLDLRDWCVHDGSGTECAADGLGSHPTEAALRRLLVDGSPEARIATVERDGRHYLSLERTLDLSIAPLLAELDGHALAALFNVPGASPHAPSETIALGEATTVQLRDGWNAVTLTGNDSSASHFRLLACSGSPGQRLEDQRVDGYPVKADHVHTRPGGHTLYVVYLDGAPTNTSASVDVRFVDGERTNC